MFIFKKINTDSNYKVSDLCEIPEGTRIPSLSTNMVRQFLDNLRKTFLLRETFRQTWHL